MSTVIKTDLDVFIVTDASAMPRARISKPFNRVSLATHLFILMFCFVITIIQFRHYVLQQLVCVIFHGYMK